MGQVSTQPTLGFKVLPTDRESGPGAGAGASGNNSIFLGSNAGLNSALSNNIVIGQGSLAGGASDTTNLNGTTIVGQGNAPLLTSKVSIGVAGALIIVGQGNLPNALVSDSSVILGQGIGAGFTGAGGASQTVIIGVGAVNAAQQLLQSVVIGYRALGNGTANAPNGTVAIGYEALFACQNGASNTCIGLSSGNAITTQSQNTFIGNLTAGGGGGGNTVIGYQSSAGSTNGTGIAIGSSLTVGADRAILIGNNSSASVVDSFAVQSGFGGTYPLIFGIMATGGGTTASGNIILGSDTARNLGGTPGTNMLKLTNGTAATGAAITGGGYFYSSGGNLHWVDTGGFDSVLSFGTGQVGSVTGVALTNNAAAAVGTITNAPAAGNPTKWAPFNDNGTIRNIPMW